MIQKTHEFQAVTVPNAIHRVEKMDVVRFPLGSRSCSLRVRVYANPEAVAAATPFCEYQHIIGDAQFDAVFSSELALSGFAQADQILLAGPLSGGTQL